LRGIRLTLKLDSSLPFIEKRVKTSPMIEFLSSIGAVAAGLLCGGLLAYLEYGDFSLVGTLISWPYANIRGFSALLSRFIPILITSIAVMFAFYAGLPNIGAPGQMIFGAIGATAIALFLPFNLPQSLHLALMCIVAAIAGGAWALIPAILKEKIGINLVISTMLLNYVANLFMQFLLYGPWHRPGVKFPYTAEFPPSARLPVIPGTQIHYPTLILGLILTLLIYVIIKKTPLGYEMRVISKNLNAAEYAGINRFKVTLIVMLISGALAGIAGFGEAAGVHHMLEKGITGAGAVYSEDYGYFAVLIAWLGRINVIGTVISALFGAGLLCGADALKVAGASFALAACINGLILIFLMITTFFSRYRIVLRRRAKNEQKSA